MTFWLQTTWWVFVSPSKAFSRIAHAPSVGAAVVLINLLCLLFLTSLAVSSAMRYQRKRASRLMKKDAVPIVVIVTLLFPALWLWFALLTQGLLHLFHISAEFDTLFCLLTFTVLPQFVGWMTYPARNLHWHVYRIWQGVMVGSTAWSTWLAGLSLHTAYGLIGWKPLLAAIPLLALLWAAGISAARDLPDSLLATCLWRRMAGTHVIVFAPRGANADDLAEIVRGAAWTMEQATKLLEVEPLAFKAGVFLFANQEEHRRIVEMKEQEAQGYSHGDCLTSAYASWTHLQGIVPHEIGHVLREQRITSAPVALLDEGLAIYINNKLYPAKTHAPLISVPHSLRILAQDVIFYNWLYVEQTDYTADHYYSHAHGFARFLIQSLGMKAFKQLLRASAQDKSRREWQDAGERLERATQQSLQSASIPVGSRMAAERSRACAISAQGKARSEIRAC